MKKNIVSFLIAHFAFLIAQVGVSQVIHVPADQPTIQAGIISASDGDTVLVAEGTYLENIDFLGKRITVASHFIMDGDTSHINNTVIDGSDPLFPDNGSVVFFRSYEDTTSVLCGFTITGGTGSWEPGPQIRVGGGIYINNVGAKIIHNHITGNHIAGNYGGSGGGIGAGDIFSNATVIIRNNRITNNTIDVFNVAEGGGIVIYCNGIIEDNIISQNEISTQFGLAVGAGIRCVGASERREIYLSGNMISHNTLNCGSVSVYGGAGGMQALNCTGTIRNNQITDNENYSDYGAIGGGMHVAYCDSSLLLLENNLIAGNVANMSSSGASMGGGIYSVVSSVRLINNAIIRNYADEGAGIYIHYNQGGPFEIINNTIALNQSNSLGGALYVMDADAIVLNSILWNGPEEIYLSGGNVEAAYSDISGGWPGEGNIDADPGFIDENCHIDEYSPCVDNGAYSFAFNGNWYDAPEYDLEGTPRPYAGGGIDIGAYECDIFQAISQPAASILHSTFSIQNYPNPTRGIVNCQLSIVDCQRVSVRIYDIHGREMATVLDQEMPAGEHTLQFDASGLPAGLYYFKLRAGNQEATGKMIRVE